MATWVRTNTAAIDSGTNSNLTGNSNLGNATAPADFDPAGVTQVKIDIDLVVTGLSDDAIDTNTGEGVRLEEQTLNTNLGGGTYTTNAGSITTNGTHSVQVIDNAPSTTHTTAEWEGAQLDEDGTANLYASYNQSGMPDGGKAAIPIGNATVTITYTPATTDRTAQVAWAELEVPAPPMPDYVRGWARGIETASSTTITINKPTGTVENDIMYAYIVHESAAMTSDTPPSGWADVGTNPHAFGGGNAYVYKKTAGASEGSSYVFTFDPSNQMVGYIVTVKNTYTEDALSIALVDDADDAVSDSTFTETLTTSTSATGVLAIFGHDAPVGSTNYFNSTTSMDKRDETSDGYGPAGALAAWFTEEISSQSSITETWTYDDATTGYDFPVLLVSFIPSSTDRTAQVGWTELEIPTAPRTAQLSWAELEIPNGARTAIVSWAELEVPTAPRTAQVSWAELEVPTAPRTAQVSWAEIELPEPPKAARVSWTELEIPDGARTAIVSWAELEVPTAPRTVQLSWTELEIGDAPRAAQVSWAELETPETTRAVQVSWAELEVPTAPRTAQISWAEMELPNGARTAQVAWAEMELPDAARAAIVTWAELEVPTAPRRAQVAWAEFEAPNAPRTAQVSWAELEIPPGPGRSCIVVWTELSIPDAPGIDTRTNSKRLMMSRVQ